MSEAESSAKARILIVDDQPENLHTMMTILHDKYAVVAATSGEKALEFAARQPQPDLILLDIRMPGMDGFETCRRMKGMESTREIPVIFITALTETEEKIRGFGAGAVDYVTKPIQPEEFMARVGVHLRIRELTAGLQKALAEIKTLHGILPICSVCKKIRDDSGSWTQMEWYIREHSEAEFSHGYCPECAQKFREELMQFKARNPGNQS